MCRAQNLKFRAQNLKFRAQDLKFRAQDLKFRAQDLKFRAQDLKFTVAVTLLDISAGCLRYKRINILTNPFIKKKLQFRLPCQVLFERLSMSAADLRECQIELGGSVNCPIEPLIVPYLAGCIRRCDFELKDNNSQQHVVVDTLKKCRSAAVRMIG